MASQGQKKGGRSKPAPVADDDSQSLDGDEAVPASKRARTANGAESQRKTSGRKKGRGRQARGKPKVCHSLFGFVVSDLTTHTPAPCHSCHVLVQDEDADGEGAEDGDEYAARAGEEEDEFEGGSAVGGVPEDTLDENGEQQLFCVCKQPYDPRRFMIG
jgi:hypothetical protein